VPRHWPTRRCVVTYSVMILGDAIGDVGRIAWRVKPLIVLVTGCSVAVLVYRAVLNRGGAQ
jgi:hypothetical protein